MKKQAKDLSSMMRAVSVHQPWAWAILHAGKVFENRTWRTRHRGPLLIHASKSTSGLGHWHAEEWEGQFGCELPRRADLAFRALVGIVDVIDCVRIEDVPRDHPGRRWAEGPWCWVLANPRPFAEPIPYRGRQLLFEVPDEVLAGLDLAARA